MRVIKARLDSASVKHLDETARARWSREKGGAVVRDLSEAVNLECLA